MMRRLRELLFLGLVFAGTARSQDVAAGQETVRRAIHVCASCHGDSGRSVTKGIPALAGQIRQYTIAQLKDFRSQNRVESGSRAYMWGISALLDDTTIEGLADYYAGEAPLPGRGAKSTSTHIGARLFTQGAPERGVRPCASCHGSNGEGAAAFPRLAGQRADYVYAQLKTFGTQLRPHGIVMRNETRAMSEAELRAVAEYVQSL
jgi:cytochrome c553